MRAEGSLAPLRGDSHPSAALKPHTSLVLPFRGPGGHCEVTGVMGARGRSVTGGSGRLRFTCCLTIGLSALR